uniref:Hydroxyacid oxidase n=2 Tax=Nephromyces sp. MMRI TaxID=2496275 RepID=A0A3Q8UBW3_9APIC|nr:hydroxyacid oxidase [Nephromyces sp. MMRI]
MPVYQYDGKSFVCIDDFHQYALQTLAKTSLDYYESGAEDELTLKANLESFKNILINPRLLVDISHIDTSSSILGNKVSMPIGFAPTALHRLAHDEGEKATAKAAFDAGIAMCLSSYSTTSIEDVALSTNHQGILFFQLYFNINREITTNLLKRAHASGYKAIALTIDAQVSGFRRKDHKNKFTLPSYMSFANFENQELLQNLSATNSSSSVMHNLLNSADHSITWEDLAWIKEISQLPLIVKGILNAEDAELALKFGADAVWITNHGGRQIDGCRTAIEVLPEVCEALKGSEIEIYVDGGVRKGSDVYKALALGADHVFIGRPVLYGLASGGQQGVSAVINILHDELQRNMQLSGKVSIKNITRTSVMFRK